MIKPDPQDELTTLARARAGLAPSPADAVRVRASLVAALAASGDGAPDAGPSGSGPGVGAGGGWPLRVLVTSVAAAVVGAGAFGYWIGHRAGSREALPAAVQTVANQSVPASHPAAAAAAGVPSPGQVSPPPIGDAASVQQVIRRRSGSMARSARPEVIASPTESLGQEVRALRAVEHALREDDSRLALAILQQLDRDVPKGKLVEERRATSVIARCSAGDVPFGVNWAEDFASDYPDSVYRGRVEQSCKRRAGGK